MTAPPSDNEYKGLLNFLRVRPGTITIAGNPRENSFWQALKGCPHHSSVKPASLLRLSNNQTQMQIKIMSNFDVRT